MKRNRAIPLAIVSACILLVVLLGGMLRASASVAPFVRYQQTYSVGLINDLPTIRGAQPGMIAACAENGKAYVAQPSAAYTVSPPRVVAGYAGDGIVWVDFLTVASPITSSFIGSITWGQIVPSSIPSTLAGHSITNGVTIARAITASSAGPITVNSARSTTLAGDVALGFNWGSPVGVVPGGANSAGTSASAARADHVHTVPVGTVSGTVAAGNDARLSDDRVASGLRSATTVVGVSSATAPSQYQVLMGNSSTSASWQFVGNNSVIDNALSPGKLTLGGANQLVTSNGSSNSWAAMSDALHGNRGGGSLHSVSTTSEAGFQSATDKTRADAVYAASLLTLNDHSAALPASYRLGVNGTQSNNALVMGAVAANTADISAHFVGNLYDGVAPRITGSNRVLLSSNGTSSTWGAITDSYITGPIGWGKIGSTPTTLSGYGITDATPSNRIISATAPLRIDGTSSANMSANRTLSIDAASGSAAGSMSALHYTRLEKIPDPTTDKMGYILTPSGLSETYTLQPPANMGILTTATGISGSGSAGYIPKFSGTRTLTNSKLFENSNGIAIGHTNAEGPLDIRGSSGNTSLTLYDTTNPNAHFLLVASAPEAGTGLFYLVNGSTSAIPLGIKHSGEVGINTIGPTATLDVNGTFRWRGGSPAAGYLMAATDSNGNATWSSTAGLGLFKNGDSYAILSDGLKLSATGVEEIRGGSLGYTTQVSTGSGKDITMRAQSTNDGSAGQRGGNVEIYAGSAPLGGSATQGEITLITGSGLGETGIIAKTTKFSRNGVSGWVAVKSPSVPVYEEQQWSSATTAGNAQGTIWFNSWDGVSGIPNDTYRLEFDVIATRTDGGAGAYAAKLIATVVKQGGSITQTALRTVYKDSALVFDWSSPAPDAVALLFNQTGSAAYNHKWIVKASIIREP